MSATEFRLWCDGMGFVFTQRVTAGTKTLALMLPDIGVLAWAAFMDAPANEQWALRWLRRKAREAMSNGHD